METICVRFEESFMQDIEKIMKEHRYSTKTEFIREAIRDKFKELEKQKTLARLELAYGAGAKKGRKISDEDIHTVRKQVAKEFAKKLGVELD